MLLKIRLLHSSSRASNLIGPPDPLSNLRPVLYTDLPPSSQPRPRHPYSLSEFTGGTQDHNLQWRLQRQALDAFNHNYWTDVGFLFLILTASAHSTRVTLVSKKRNKASYHVSQNHPHHSHASMLFLNSIGNGSCKNHAGEKFITPSGGNGTLRRSYLPCASNGGTCRTASQI